MESLVKRYLDTTFTIDVENHTVIDSEGDKTYAIDLVLEVVDIFDLHGDEAEDFIENWLIQTEPKFDLEIYWADKKWDGGDSILPIAMRVAAQTVGNDLVSVQPMAAPTGQLMYMDFVYSGTNRNNQHYQVDMDEVTSGINQMVIGELDHPEPEFTFPDTPSDNYRNHWISEYSRMHINLEDSWGPILSGITMI